MSELTNIFSNIANSIRNLTGSSDLIYPNNMANVINNISASGNAVHISPSLSNLSNAPVIIENNVTTLAGCFRGMQFFNQNVIIPDSVTNMDRCFSNCTYFNKSITIPNNVTDMQYTFSYCSYFNKPITIPDSVEILVGTFQSCLIDFNQPINIPNNVWIMSSIFENCYKFNQRLVIPENVNQLQRALYHCNSYNSSIYILGNTFRDINVSGLLSESGTLSVKNIYFNIALNSVFNRTNPSNSIAGRQIYWTVVDINCYYDSSYNIYCYSNFSGRAEDVPPLN